MIADREADGRRPLFAARQIVVDLDPERLRPHPDVLAQPDARIVVERAHRHDREAAVARDAWRLRAADPAERLREEPGLRDLVLRELPFPAREPQAVDRHDQVGGVRGGASLAAPTAVAAAR